MVLVEIVSPRIIRVLSFLRFPGSVLRRTFHPHFLHFYWVGRLNAWMAHILAPHLTWLVAGRDHLPRRLFAYIIYRESIFLRDNRRLNFLKTKETE